ncbi:MAG: acetate--CoA ligase [Thermoproteus sp. AZ2]|jgi:4-hydroxybutyrate---CoA ligase (AMP-forming)|uniref:Acetate--CoA ligase n=1 Tax=Thermoproteus sp. AZ2 TaxID=1609232 RepID=A0ACC6V412_9CREN
MSKEFLEVYRKSLEDPIGFWAREAEPLYWKEKWKVAYDDSRPPFYRWFVGGKFNIVYNLLERNIDRGLGNKAAFIWASSDGAIKVYRYYDLAREVNRYAYAFRELGMRKGDRVVIYMPMIPEALFAFLAVERLGAIHSVVFSGFGAQALADRIADAGASWVITTDGMYRRGKEIKLKPIVDEAVAKAGGGARVLVFRRTNSQVPMSKGDVDMAEMLKGVGRVYVEPEWAESESPLFILYTSGTTGKPKGIVHLNAQYAVWIRYAFSHLVGAETPWRDKIVFFSTADLGWISGHHYGVHGPLLNGLTVVWYEDAPDYPDPGVWWRLVDELSITHILFSPTAIRLLMKYGDDVPRRYSLETLMAVYPTGEVLNEEAYKWIVANICRNRRDCQVADIWGQTETACFVTAPGSMNLGGFRYKYGAVGLPYPGLQLMVLDDEGRPLPPGSKGHVAAKPPLPPAFLAGVWGDERRYVEGYWSRFKGLYYTGDYGMIDEEGYLHVYGRTDDVIKVAGHRLSTREVEDIVASYPGVAEAAVVGIPDPVRGEVLGIFVVPKAGAALEPAKIADHVRATLGPTAVIGKIAIVGKLPKTRSGKVMRRLLRAVATGAPLGDVSTLEDEAAVDEVKRAYEELARELSK